MIKVLFISQWYPHRYDLMKGLFVQKHAEAVSLYCEVKVLYIHPDENIKTIEIVNQTHKNITEKIVYFPVDKSSVFYKFKMPFSYISAYYKGFNQILAEGFTPEIIHSNILTRTGFVAYLIKKWKAIPYVVTEHYSRYLVGRDAFNGVFRKYLTRIVVKNAEYIMPVSLNLQTAMLQHGLINQNYKVVYNVVDDFFFEKSKIETRTKKRMIHISCIDNHPKNIKGILRATYELSKIRTDFELIIIGNGVDYDELYKMYESLKMPDGTIRFVGEKSPNEVAQYLQNSDFFVLFSNYESASVVIAESLVCGVPVISTVVGIAPQVINNLNGIFIPVQNESELLKQMNFMLDNFENFNKQEIMANAKSKFSSDNIGKMINDIYAKALTK